MGQRRCIGFPILAVKLVDRHIQVHPVIQATPGDREAILIRAWDVKALYPARLTKLVFGAARIERVLAEMVSTFEQAKSGCRDDHVNIPAHRADRAIAILHLERFR